MSRLFVLDLFSGWDGWSLPWIESGHEVLRVDFNPKTFPDKVCDINNMTPYDIPNKPMVIMASPPCEKFSVMTISKNWNKAPLNTPKTREAAQALELVRNTVKLIEALEPKYFIVENPVGKLRKLDSGLGTYDKITITQCSYGKPWRKATDLWGIFPSKFNPPKPCKLGSSCHINTKGSGVSGWKSRQTELSNWGGKARDYRRSLSRARIPYSLSADFMFACLEEI